MGGHGHAAERPRARPSPERRRVRWLLVVVVLAAVLGVVLGMALVIGRDDAEPAAQVPPERGPASGARALTEADLWLSFDDPRTTDDDMVEYLDAAGGPFVGRVQTANGGSVEPVAGADGGGLAVQFPVRCLGDSGCPRAMIEIEADPRLDPDEAPFSYGASVWLDPGQTAPGANIVQRGRFGSAGGQWKLQVDGQDGRPSCVVRSDGSVVTVRASVSVADTQWHRVVCRRDADGVSIEVDGAVVREAARTGSVSNDAPIRVGSPGVGDGDDQFHGRIDDVFVMIDAP